MYQVSFHWLSTYHPGLDNSGLTIESHPENAYETVAAVDPQQDHVYEEISETSVMSTAQGLVNGNRKSNLYGNQELPERPVKVQYLAVHIQDMKSRPGAFQSEFKVSFYVISSSMYHQFTQSHSCESKLYI